MTLKKIAITELVEDYHLYPRREVDGSTVDEFRDALKAGAKFPPIRVCAKTLRIIDGFHRKTAYERERATHVLCSLEDVSDDADLFRRAMAANASHGRRYNVDDYSHTIRLAKRLGLTREQISADLLLPLERVEKLERMWTGKQAKLERNLPSANARSKRVEKSMDTISQVTWVNSLLRCLREGYINERSEELREGLEALRKELDEHVRRTAEQREREAVPPSTRRRGRGGAWVRLDS